MIHPVGAVGSTVARLAVLFSQQPSVPSRCVPPPSELVTTAIRLRAEQSDPNAFLRAF